MFKKLLMTIIAMLMSASLYAGINFDNPKNNNFKEELANLEVNVPVPVLGASDKNDMKDWTIMVYINSKNNLERFGLEDMNEMEMVGSSDRVNVVVELGRIASYDSSDGDWISSRRYLAQKDGDTTHVTSPVVADLGKVDMGDYNHLIEFGNWSKTNYPAKHYMLIVWNHGSGWNKKGPAELTKGISYDDETHNHITTQQLALALQSIGKLDVYGSDACLMQMPEVNYAIKDNIDYIVGSEHTEPGDGYTYDTMLAPLIANPLMTPEELGKLTVDTYADNYRTKGSATTQSLLKASAMDGLVPLINDFVAVSMNANEKALVKKAVSGAQSYSNDGKDLWHFLKLYSDSSASAEVKLAAANLQNYVTGTLILHNRVTGYFDAAKHNGLSVYLPGYSFNKEYFNLAWAGVTQWDEFVNWYLAKDNMLLAKAY